MKVNIQQNGNDVAVTLQGEFDTVATTQLNDVLNRITDLASQHLTIDCKDMEYIS
jgi:anti-anti-sigma regulatory factor